MGIEKFVNSDNPEVVEKRKKVIEACNREGFYYGNTCDSCHLNNSCQWAWDAYNLNGDCIIENKEKS